MPGDGAAQGLRCLQIRQAAHRGGLAGQDIRTLGPLCLYRYLSKFNSNLIQPLYTNKDKFFIKIAIRPSLGIFEFIYFFLSKFNQAIWFPF